MYRKARSMLLLFFVHTALFAQHANSGRIYDANSGEPVPFATIKFGETGRGVVAGLDGKFELPEADITSIEVSCLGYLPQKIMLPAADLNIRMQPVESALTDVVIKPPYEKIHRILNNVIANKSENDPNKYDWYRCNVYYKMIADIEPAKPKINHGSKKRLATESEKNKAYADSVKRSRVRDFLENQHLLMSETYSIRTWRKPQQLQEEVLASRFSGFKKSMFTGLVTDVLPFHAYTDYINLNGKDYHNPVSRGYERYYKFNIADEIVQGVDTVWIMSFTPRGHNTNELKGTVYINSSGYAISQVIARAKDTMLNMDVRIEQQYEQLPVANNGKRWFPKHLNYVIDWQQGSGNSISAIHMKGYSRIDSVSWDEDKDFRFDKTHTVKLKPKADELNETTWQNTRPEPLNAKEVRTYRVIDSLGAVLHLDKTLAFTAKLPSGKVPIGFLDLDLKRLFNWNDYENVRLGLGLQTNERIVKWMSIGGWGGYGFADKKWKYGAFAEFYADRYKEFAFKADYSDDINDPGRIRMNTELDKNYLNAYLLQRVDETKTITLSVKRRFGYLGLELAGRQQAILPRYKYNLLYDGANYSTFTANEVSLAFRYAYAERTAPFFSSYYSLGSKYPVWYGKITTGGISTSASDPGSSLGPVHIPYTQVVTAVVWHKHINRVGFEHFLVEGGKSWSGSSLPLSKLFAGNGYNYDSKSFLSLYTFGGLMTMLPYGYYTDQFVNVIYRHDFDWKLYKIENKDTKLSSAPNICLQYNLLYGTLAHPEAQQYVNFTVPSNGYHEAGLLLNNILRTVYANLYYLTLNAGYFYHLTPSFDAAKNGRVVVGLGVEL